LKYTAWVLGLIWLAPVWAGDKVGNGGDGMLCVSADGSRSYQVLDYFEALQKDPAFRFSFAAATKDPYALVGDVIRELANFDRPRAAAYAAKLKRFPHEILQVDGPLEPVPDTGPITIPAGCSVFQLAIQRPPAFPTDKRYLVDKLLWARLDAVHQAGLILHEIVYGETLALGHETSETARAFNRAISAEGFSKMTAAEYRALVDRTFRSTEKVAFQKGAFDLLVRAGETVRLSLPPLLEHRYKRPLHWSVDESIPSWLELDAGRALLVGVAPATPERSEFNLVVRLGRSMALAAIRVDVMD
jgi:hypothetical protein